MRWVVEDIIGTARGNSTNEAPLVDVALALAIEPADCSGPNRNISLASIADSWRNSLYLSHLSFP
jgi:hypothetical protein